MGSLPVRHALLIMNAFFLREMFDSSSWPVTRTLTVCWYWMMMILCNIKSFIIVSIVCPHLHLHIKESFSSFRCVRWDSLKMPQVLCWLDWPGRRCCSSFLGNRNSETLFSFASCSGKMKTHRTTWHGNWSLSITLLIVIYFIQQFLISGYVVVTFIFIVIAVSRACFHFCMLMLMFCSH